MNPNVWWKAAAGLVLWYIAMMIFVAVAGAATTQVQVTANVKATCQIVSAGSVSFNLDPASGTTVVGTVVQPRIWCTKGTAYTIQDDNGMYEAGITHRMKHATKSEYIAYSFSYTASGTGLGKSTPITMNISSTVLGAEYIDKSEGIYKDTVTLTVLP